VLDEQAQLIKNERLRLAASLAAIDGLEIYASEANFLLVALKEGLLKQTALTARGLFEALKTRGILVKYVGGMHPMLQSCLRLTVGSPEENDLMMATIIDILGVNHEK
jgi:histidinol-phosphate aminotransferase